MATDKKALDLLMNAIKKKKPCAPIRHLIGEDNIEGAYDIQEQLNKARQEAGSSVIGAKIGLTSKAVQVQLGVDQPDYGVLFDDMQIQNGGTVAWKELMQPKAEAEVAFIIQNDLEGHPISRVKLIGSIKAAYVSIEVVGSRIKDWDIGITDTIADNASSSHFVLGDRASRLTEVDLQRARMELKVNGEVVSKGKAGDSMDSPINALLWLANKMSELGNPLKAGSIILTGALGPTVDLRPGDKLEATIDGLGSCSFAVSKK
ncbi:MAG: 2-keto-4-pentenoate hydratase [Flavobacteriales bacterium]|nr:2-keto-4-pentenoate hydratase [Flavobacteriales bacterium]